MNDHAQASAQRPSSLPWWIRHAARIAFTVALFAGTACTSKPRSAPEAHAIRPRSVAVLEFQDASGDPSLDWMGRGLGELLGSALSRSEELDVYDTQRLADLAGRKDSTTADAGDLERLRGLGISRAVVGSVVRSGARLRIQGRVVEVETGRVLHSEWVEGAVDDDLFRLAGGLINGLQTALEIDLIGAQTGDQWLRQITTHSVDAYRDYLDGRTAFLASRWAEASHAYEQALAIDSTFIAARFDLTGCYWNLEQGPNLAASLRAAGRLRAHASRREALQLDLIESVVEGDAERLVRVAGELHSLYPENRFFTYLLGRGYYSAKRYPECIDTLEPLVRARYEWAWTYILAAGARDEVGRSDDARRVFELGMDVTHANPEVAFAFARFLEKRGQLARAQELLLQAERSPDLEQTPEFEAAIRVEMAKFYENAGKADSARAEYVRARALASRGSEESRAAAAGLRRLSER